MNIELAYQSLLKAILVGPDQVVQFYTQLEKQNHNDSELVEFALYVLENAVESTGYTAIYKAGHIIEQKGTPEHLERLIRIRPNLPALKGLRDYRVDFDHYIQLLQDKKAGICVCRSYSCTNTSTSNPNFKVISTDHENYTETVSCIHCGKIYKVEVDLGYHFPIYRWLELT